MSVPKEMKTLLKVHIVAPMSNSQRKAMVEKFPRPQVQELKPLYLDATTKLLVSKTASGHDGWLQKMQALTMDIWPVSWPAL